MRRLTLITAILIFMMLLNGCNNSDLKAEKEQLQSEIKTLHSEIDALQKVRDGLIQKEEIVYIIELEISQSHLAIDFKNNLKDSLNKISVPIQVSEEYYYSVEVGETLSDEFRIGSFLYKGSIGNWNIKIINKQIVNRAE